MRLFHASQSGFTLLELIIVILMLGMLSISAAPRLLSLGTDARIAGLNSIASQMESTNKLVQYKARIQGIKTNPVNPGNQSAYIVEFEGFSTEVMHNNLCPEPRSELGTASDYFDFINVSDGLFTRTTNQYALIGYQLPSSGTPNNQGCYVLYDSFALDCPVTIITADC